MQDSEERRHVVIVGADHAFCTALGELLQKADYAAGCVADLRRGLSADGSGHPALLVLDVVTPARGAVQASEFPQSLADIPFIVLSKRDDEAIARYALEKGAMGYLVRSADPTPCLPAVMLAIGRAEELRQLRDRARHLTTALQQGRAISMAIGVIMERLRLNRDNAFEALRNTARTRRRRIDQVAMELLGSVESLNSATGVSLDVAAKVPES